MDKIYSTCRVCLTEDKSGVSIFDVQDNMIYCDLIKEYTGLEMAQNDSLPNMICDECGIELMVVVKFISKCRLSHSKLEKVLNSNYIDIQPVKKEKIESFNDSFSPSCCNDEDEEELKIECDTKSFEGYDSGNSTSNLPSNNSSYLSKESIVTKSKKTIRKQQESKWECSECGTRCASRSALEIHIRKHTGEKPFQCTSCPKKFAVKGQLKDHCERIHSDIKIKRKVKSSLVCEVCGKVCKLRGDLKVHMRTHTAEKPYHCPYCPKSFSQRAAVSRHKKIHTGERPFGCTKCTKRFICSTSLKKHMVSHSDEKKFKCRYCEILFKSKDAASRHVSSIHMLNKFVCSICARTFSTLNNVKLHVKSQHSELAGTCEYCNKTSSNLPEHMRIHTGEKPYECNICKKKFAILKSFTIHLKRHANESRYPCTYDACKSAFALEWQLKFHISKVHEKIFTHVCKYCSRGFYRKSDLVYHITQKYCKEYKGPLETDAVKT